MKVLYLNPDRGIPVLGGKGASVHVREFVTALARQVEDIVLVCATLGEGNVPPPARMVELPPGEELADLVAEAVALGLPPSILEDRIARREVGRLAYDRRFCDEVQKQIGALGFQPDVIYERFALFHSAGATLARALAVPRILEVNAPLIEEQERFRGLNLKSVAVAAQTVSFGGADAIIAVSDEIADFVEATGIASNRIETIPNGVDTTRFSPGANGESARSRLGLGDGPVIGFIGSFKPWHGVAFLIDAFATIARSDPTVQLLCVGEGPELVSAHHAIAAQGLDDRVVFTGRVPYDEIPACLACMDVSVAPYLPSPDFYFSPLKVVESLAVGTPVVASRIGQLEYLIDDGRTGALFTPGSKDDLIAKIVDLLADSARRTAMGLEARKRALAEFSWDRAAGRIVGEAKRLAGAARVA